MADLSAIRIRLKELNEQLNGDALLVKYEGQSRTSLKGKTDLIIYSLWTTTAAPTGTYERAYEEAREAFAAVLDDLGEVDAWVHRLETQLEESGAPYTPGRFPAWKND